MPVSTHSPLDDRVSSSSDPPSRHNLTRRNFFISLGAGVGGIAGYFCFAGRPIAPPPTESVPVPSGPTAHPRLRDEACISSDGELYTISVPGTESPTVCGVNPVGAEIVQRLTGQQTIGEICADVAAAVGICHDEAIEAKIACFVAELASLGFLRDPFYVYIVDRVA